MKKNYVKPDIKVYEIEKNPMLICASVGAKIGGEQIVFGNGTEEGGIISID
ncbi:MAG: hypothetical protein MR960_04745 [Prevotella sp.]|nr:hypothetical protein [Prevotella sp.]